MSNAAGEVITTAQRERSSDETEDCNPASGFSGFQGRCAKSPNDPKLSDRGARRGLCAGEGGEGAKAVGSIGRDVRSGSLQRMVRPLCSIVEKVPLQELKSRKSTAL